MPTLIAVALAFHALGQASRIDSLMGVLVDQKQFSGTVLVADKGEIIYHKAFGLANREWNVPATVDTRYKLALVRAI